jgi:hypothetical protein
VGKYVLCCMCSSDNPCSFSVQISSLFDPDLWFDIIHIWIPIWLLSDPLWIRHMVKKYETIIMRSDPICLHSYLCHSNDPNTRHQIVCTSWWYLRVSLIKDSNKWRNRKPWWQWLAPILHTMYEKLFDCIGKTNDKKKKISANVYYLWNLVEMIT